MKFVFLVLHVYELLPQEEETFKIIGAYETKKGAQLAIRRKKRCVGFRDHPKGFHVYQLELGKEQWSGGFHTYLYTPKKSTNGQP